MKNGISLLAAAVAATIAMGGHASAQTLLGTCVGTVGVVTQSDGAGNVYCTPSVAPPPAVSITASPSVIVSGQSSTLTWGSTNATSCAASGGWTGAEPTSGTLVVSPPSTTSYTLTCTGSGGSATATASVTVQTNTGSNCGMVLGGQAVFCEPFDVANAGSPSRTGGLDPNVWGVSRASGYVNFGQGEYNGWTQTQLLSCAGTVTVSPPNDVAVCGGQLRESIDDDLSGAFEDGGVLVLAMYPRQPFDFSSGTGTVSFDVSNDSHGSHSAWPEFWITDLPVPAPFVHLDSWQALPANGFGVRLNSVAPAGMAGLCPNSNNLSQPRWTLESGGVIRNYVLEDANYQGTDYGPASTPPLTLNILDCVISPPDGSGLMNHIEIQVTPNEIDIYATDAGVAASPTTLRKIASLTNANLTFTSGLVWLEDAHYNADKGGAPSERIHTFVWDNLAFDGPFTHRDFGYDALDNNAAGPYPGSVLLGQASPVGGTADWNVLGVPASPSPAAVLVLFNFYHDTPPTTLTVTVNGNAHSIPWPYPDMINSTWRTYALTVPVTDLVAGTNVVSIGATDQSIVSSNVDIVLGNVPGGVPVLPGNSRSYP